jgi:octaprenyl-diphosphate synthase
MHDTSKTVSSDPFQLKIKEYQIKVDNAVSAELNMRRDSAYFAPLTQALKGGKRIRPVLLILCFEAVGGQGNNPLPAAVAVELAHTESLIHDDIIDEDVLRRKTPAFHAVHGYEMALLSADFILSIILDLTARYDDPRIAQSLAQATSKMSEGELQEIRIHKNRQSITMNEYLNVISKKTASLFEASAAIGATIGNGKKPQVETLAEYGRLLGTAYQIQDDISDSEKASINISNFLTTDQPKKESLQQTLELHILKAKQKLEKIEQSNAKTRLINFADHVTSNQIDTT